MESFRDEEKRLFLRVAASHTKTLMELNQNTHKQIVIGRELTKIYEEFFRGTVEEAYQY